MGKRNNEAQAGHLPHLQAQWALVVSTGKAECAVDSQVSGRARGHPTVRNKMSYRRHTERESETETDFPLVLNSRQSII